MSISDKLSTHAEMTADLEFVQYLEQLVSGSEASGTGVNRSLERLAYGLDALLDTVQGTKGLFITGGGVIAWSHATNQLTWSAHIYFYFPHELGGAAWNRLPVGSSPLTIDASGKVAYVVFDRTTDANVASVGVANSMAAFMATLSGDKDRLDYHPVAYRDGDDLILWDGRRVRSGYSLSVNGFRDTQYAQQTEVTAMRARERDDLKLRLHGGGTVSWDEGTGELAWDGQLHIAFPHKSGDNYIPAGSVTLTAGDVAYVTLNRAPGGGSIDLGAPTVVADGSVPDGDGQEDVFVIALRDATDGRVYLADGTALSDGEAVLLGGVRSGLQWAYFSAGDDAQVTDLTEGGAYSNRAYRVGSKELMVYRNGAKARGALNCYWAGGVYPFTGALVGTYTDEDHYVEYDDGDGTGSKIIWIADLQAVAEPIYHAPGARLPATRALFTWPSTDDWLEVFVGLHGEGPSPVESIGLEPEPGDGPLEGAVKLKEGTNITMTYELATNSIIISASVTAGVNSLSVDGGDQRTGNIDIVSGPGIEVVDGETTFTINNLITSLADLTGVDADLEDAILDAGDSPLGTFPPSADNPLVTYEGLLASLGVSSTTSPVWGFDVILFTADAVHLGIGAVHLDGTVYQATAALSVEVSDVVAGEAVLTDDWNFIYVGYDEGAGALAGFVSPTAPGLGGLHPSPPGDYALRCLTSVYVTSGSEFKRGVKQGGWVTLEDPVSTGTSVDIAGGSALNDIGAALPDGGSHVPAVALRISLLLYSSGSLRLGYDGSEGTDYTYVYQGGDAGEYVTYDIKTTIGAERKVRTILNAQVSAQLGYWLVGYAESFHAFGDWR